MRQTHLGTADVKVLDLAELGKGILQSTVLDLAVNVLDVGALLIRVRSRSLGLATNLLLLATGCSLPSSSFALASRG
jgi:hypothetical protein